jgi:hypothetical protein
VNPTSEGVILPLDTGSEVHPPLIRSDSRSKYAGSRFQKAGRTKACAIDGNT